ncbi:FAD binding domain-containing protein [Frigidibacter sp. SLM-1]|nr:FAD binding domain-containing protein [Frigidibacter sp. ROC022]MCR8725006.1 FAD binding domain-containing protein [Frigidibacter sp. ROC022]
MDFSRPTALPEALALLAEHRPLILAGGTDLFPATERAGLSGRVLSIDRIAGLCGITETDAGLRIGAATPWAEIARHPGPPGWAALAEAAVEVGGRQIQSRGTIGGNLCNASPAADGVPPLLALEAEVELASAQATRRLPLAEFLTGPRRTALQPGELMTAIHLPADALRDRSRFLKLGARSHLVISIAMVAVRVRVGAGRIAEAALAVGACGPVAARLPEVEAALIGASPAEAPDRIDPATVAAALAPLDDIRATAAYRGDAAAVLLRRALADLPDEGTT